MAQNMGIGKLGDKKLIFKRKFRWTFRLDEICGNQSVPEHYVKLAARPNLTIEETEINFLNAKTWIPGKASWETISVTYMDVNTTDHKPLWNWLASVYLISDPVKLTQGSQRGDYSAKGTLTLFDGCGTSLEQWILQNMWPTSIDFGELDYSSSDEVNIQLTLRYSDVTYQSLCPNFKPEGCCTPCS